MITLKHLAREFKLSPEKVRKVLRSKIKKSKTIRWRWYDDNDREYLKAKEVITQYLVERRNKL